MAKPMRTTIVKSSSELGACRKSAERRYELQGKRSGTGGAGEDAMRDISEMFTVEYAEKVCYTVINISNVGEYNENTGNKPSDTTGLEP